MFGLATRDRLKARRIEDVQPNKSCEILERNFNMVGHYWPSTYSSIVNCGADYSIIKLYTQRNKTHDKILEIIILQRIPNDSFIGL